MPFKQVFMYDFNVAISGPIPDNQDEKNLLIAQDLLISNSIGSNFYSIFCINPTPILMPFTGVTNAHGPSPQPTACRSSKFSLRITTESNQALDKD